MEEVNKMNEAISKASVCEILADIYPTDGEKVVAVEEIDKAYEAIQQLPSAQLEPSIPLSWFDGQIERLKGLDNAFATLTAMQILGMVKKWSDEQAG